MKKPEENNITVYDHKLQTEYQTQSAKIEKKLMEVSIPQAYYEKNVLKSHGVNLTAVIHTQGHRSPSPRCKVQTKAHVCVK